jgi:predicted Zn-dependent peptidase
VLRHDWTHPSEFDFEESGFVPPDPGSVLVTTPSGARAYVIPEAGDPLVLVTAAVPLGRHFEAAGEVGAAAAVASALERALSRNLGPELIADAQTSQDPGMTQLSVEVMAEDWRAALAALVATLREPGLESWTSGPSMAAPGGARAQGAGRARAIAELTTLVARYPIAPPDSPVGVQPRLVRELGQSALQPGTVVFGIGGGVEPAEVENVLLDLTEGWDPPPTGARVGQPPTMEATRIPTEALQLIDVPAFLTWVALGHAMESIAPEDEAAVAVLEEVVNIRLNIATREIRGLTNRSQLFVPAATDGAGVMYVRTSGRAESVAPLIRYSVEEVMGIRQVEGAPTPEELQQAKGGLALGWWQDSLDGARRTAATYAAETINRGSLDHLMSWPQAVRAVTAEDVTASARKYIDPEGMTAVVLGPISEIRGALHPRWPLALAEVPALLRPGGSER